MTKPIFTFDNEHFSYLEKRKKEWYSELTGYQKLIIHVIAASLCPNHNEDIVVWMDNISSMKNCFKKVLLGLEDEINRYKRMLRYYKNNDDKPSRLAVNNRIKDYEAVLWFFKQKENFKLVYDVIDYYRHVKFKKDGIEGLIQFINHDEPTAKQLNYLGFLGCSIIPKTRKEVGELINEYRK